MSFVRVNRRHAQLALASGIVGGLHARAAAQFRVEMAGVGLTQVPIGIAVFKDESSAAQPLSAIVAADLERSGQFVRVSGPADALDETSRVDASVWRKANADALVVGSVTRLADGRFDVRYRLWDVVRAAELGGQTFVVSAAELRLVAHRIADAVYEKLTGLRGVFSTRIAYVTKNGNRHSLWVADADGFGALSALGSAEPIISPAWSPSGTQLAYVSFESRKPVIYVHDLPTGRRRLLANHKGSNSAPRFSPDGKTLALTLSKDGPSQIFLVDANGGEARRLSQGNSIDTEAVFAPDGQSIYFVSDRGGSPQVYQQRLRGGDAQRISFNGGYNISPAISPDGKTLAHITRVGGQFKLHVTDLSSGQSVAITDTGADERPNFSPNGRLLLYATKTGGQEALMTSTLDGRVKARLQGAAGDIREPDWGPFLPAAVVARA